jgi:hypothetical protein
VVRSEGSDRRRRPVALARPRLCCTSGAGARGPARRPGRGGVEACCWRRRRSPPEAASLVSLLEAMSVPYPRHEQRNEHSHDLWHGEEVSRARSHRCSRAVDTAGYDGTSVGMHSRARAPADSAARRVSALLEDQSVGVSRRRSPLLVARDPAGGSCQGRCPHRARLGARRLDRVIASTSSSAVAKDIEPNAAALPSFGAHDQRPQRLREVLPEHGLSLIASTTKALHTTALPPFNARPASRAAAAAPGLGPSARPKHGHSTRSPA